MMVTTLGVGAGVCCAGVDGELLGVDVHVGVAVAVTLSVVVAGTSVTLTVLVVFSTTVVGLGGALVLPPSTLTMAYVLVRVCSSRGFTAPSRGRAAANDEMAKMREIAFRCMVRMVKESWENWVELRFWICSMLVVSLYLRVFQIRILYTTWWWRAMLQLLRGRKSMAGAGVAGRLECALTGLNKCLGRLTNDIPISVWPHMFGRRPQHSSRPCPWIRYDWAA
jgi:hypothetical protein